MRVVSLVPSATETLVAWGVPPIAATRFCEQPGMPTVGGTKNPDVAAILALSPDLVVMDEEENRQADHDALVAAGVDVHVLAVRSVEDVCRQLPGLARRLGVVWEPPSMGGRAAESHRAVVPIWRRPYMVLGPGTYGASVLAHIGVTVVAVSGGGPYPVVEADQLRRMVDDQAAELVLAPSEPYPFAERHRAELDRLTGGLPLLFVDGQDLFWWGVRTPSAVARLARMMSIASL